MSTSLFFRGLLAALSLSLLPAVAQAQNATLTGRVVDQTTGQPLSDVQVVVAGTPRGSRTSEDGRFQIVGVPAGTVQVRVLRLGYQAQTRTVTLGADGTESLDFSLTPTATRLDEVVISATGATERRRESGVNTAKIDTAQVNMATVQNFSDVLSSRAPGVVVQQSGGTTGASSRIRIRGSNSISLANDPLLIIDGVRVNNNPNSTSIGVGGFTPSRFNDINPEDVESVEVIKGPAAAALYGTAASNGVIQVTTKRGKAGKARWQANTEYGTVRQVGAYPRNYRQIGITNLTGARQSDCNLDRRAQNLCTPKPDSLISNLPLEIISPFRDGWREQFGTNVSGGSDVAQYYIGGDFEREEGVYPTNGITRGNARANINAQVRSNLQLSLNGGYTGSRLRLLNNDNNGFGAISGSLIGKAFNCHPASEDALYGPRDVACGGDTASRGYFNANHPSTDFFVDDIRQNIERLLGSVQANWQPASWLSVIGVSGMDLVERWDTETFPAVVVDLIPDGYRVSNNTQIRTYSSNVSAAGTFGLRPDLRSVTTVGTQWNREVLSRTDASGEVLLPGTSSLNGTSALFAVDESNSDIITLGYLATQRLEWRDKVFLTGGIRADKNSNFGVNLPFVKYPSAQLSWVVGEEGFFPKQNFVNSLRLRGAYGESGQRPDFRQADKFFNPVAVNVEGNEVSGITIGGAGNADLRPERTKEFEFGFDAGFLNDRANFEFTRYSKQTKDALISRRLAPSIGATVTQIINLGRVDNKGYEYLINVKPLVTERFKLDLTVNGSVNDNKVVDLGKDDLGVPIPPVIFGLGGDTQRHQNGYPLGAYFGRRIVSFNDLNGDGIISRVNCRTYGNTVNPQIVGGPACEIVLSDTAEYGGTGLGRTELAITPSVTLFNVLNIRALFDHRGGVTLNNSTEFFRCSTSGTNCHGIESTDASLLEQARAISTRMGTRAPYFEKADFWKLRELAFTFNAPQRFANSLRASSASITIAGRNLKTWTDYTGIDPELNFSGSDNFSTADFLTQPPVRYWVGRVNLTF